MFWYIQPGGFVTVTLSLCPKSVRSRATEEPPVATSSTTDTPVCPKCDTINKSGKRSCCVRVGAWFKNCGDVGDSHLWAEDTQASKVGCEDSEFCDTNFVAML